MHKKLCANADLGGGRFAMDQRAGGILESRRAAWDSRGAAANPDGREESKAMGNHKGAGNIDDASPEFVYALNHPLRRTILRLMLNRSEAVSPNEISMAIDRRLSNVAYHVRVLVKTEAAALVRRQSVRGAVEHFYQPSKALRSSKWVKNALSETEIGDEDRDKTARRETKNS
jgi:DNA-binding transcriptional ArsR family regulator